MTVIKRVQHYRQAPAVAATFVGREGEIIVETVNFLARVHDGLTPGGFPLLTTAQAANTYVSDDTFTVFEADNTTIINGIAADLNEVFGAFVLRSQYASLALADIAATAAGAMLVLNGNDVLVADQILSARAILPAGGKITLGIYALTIRGAVIDNGVQWLIFNSTGRVTFDTPATAYRWDNMPGMLTPDMLGAGSLDGTADDTAKVQQIWDGTTSAGRLVMHKRSYYVDKVTLNYNERNFDGNCAAIKGRSSGAQPYVVKFAPGYSNIRNMIFDAQGKTNYECVINHFTNELATGTNFPSYSRFYGIVARNGKIGLNIGARVSQGGVINNSDYVDVTQARNAPVSENTWFGYQAENCPIPLRIEQPNGKIVMVGAQLIALTTAFGGAAYAGPVRALLGTNASELTLLGGSLICPSDGATADRYLFEFNSSFSCRAFGTVVETYRPGIMSAHSRFMGSGLQNFGLNYSGDAFEVIDDNAGVASQADGEFVISDTVIGRPANYGPTGGHPLIVVNAAAGGAPSVAVNFHARFVRAELRDCTFTIPGISSDYTPFVRGCRAHFTDCRLTSYNPTRNLDLRLHDGDEKLRGLIDLQGKSIATAAATGAGPDGGWSFASTAGGTWQMKSDSLPQCSDEQYYGVLYLDSISAGKVIAATTPKFFISPDKTDILRGWFKPSQTGVGTFIVRAYWYDWDGVAMGTASTDLFAGLDTKFVNMWQPVMWLLRAAPPGTAQCAITLACQDGAQLRAVISVR